MGIRELAAAAKVAEEAAANAERKRLWALNAARGKQSVLDRLGVEGTVKRAFHDKEREHGDGTTVLLEEGLYVKVAVRNVYGERSYYGGERPIIETKIGFWLCDEQGNSLRSIYDPVYSLVELGDAIAKSEAYEAERAEREANKAKV